MPARAFTNPVSILKAQCQRNLLRFSLKRPRGDPRSPCPRPLPGTGPPTTTAPATAASSTAPGTAASGPAPAPTTRNPAERSPPGGLPPRSPPVAMAIIRAPERHLPIWLHGGRLTLPFQSSSWLVTNTLAAAPSSQRPPTHHQPPWMRHPRWSVRPDPCRSVTLPSGRMGGSSPCYPCGLRR